MTSGELRRITYSRIIPCFNRGVIPPIEPASQVSAINQIDFLLKKRASGAQNELHCPFHAVDAVAVANCNRSASVRSIAKSKIDGRNRNPAMRYGIVEFHTKSCPGAPQSHERLLNCGIRIEHRFAADFIYACINMPAEIREYDALYIFIFQVDRPPRMLHFGVAHIVTHRIRVDVRVSELVPLDEKVKHRVSSGSPSSELANEIVPCHTCTLL